MNHAYDVQINNFDSYQSVPCNLDYYVAEVSQVPVIRIYGSLLVAQSDRKYNYNTLIHVHNYYPYVYLSCDHESTADVSDLIAFLELELAASFRYRKKTDDEADLEEITPTSNNKRKYIASVSICKAIPIYGFNVGYKLFYKINFLGPLYKSRFGNLFHGDDIKFDKFASNKYFKFELFESHLPFLQQFLFDFNLYGCNLILFDTACFRHPIINGDDIPILKNHLKPKIKYVSKFPRIGRSLLELDITTNDITNRSELLENHLHTQLETAEVFDSITLTSTNSIKNEIVFQSKLNHLDYEFDAGIINSHDNLLSKWSNDLHLRSLFDYAIKLTNKIKDPSMDAYNKAFLANDKLHKYPTAFRVVDIEKVRFGVLSRDDLLLLDELFLSDTQDPEDETSSVHEASDVETGVSDEVDKDEDEEVSDEVDKDEDEDEEVSDEVDKDEDEEAEEDVNDADGMNEDSGVHEEMNTANDSQIIQDLSQRPYKRPPDDLSRTAVLKEFDQMALLKVNYDDPFYEKIEDIPSKALVFSNKKIKILQKTPNWMATDGVEFSKKVFDNLKGNTTFLSWEYKLPPLRTQVIDSYRQQQEVEVKRAKYASQLEPPLSRSYDISGNFAGKQSSTTHLIKLTNFIMELHVNTDTGRLPNPKTDEISAIFFTYIDSNGMFLDASTNGIIVNEKFLNDIKGFKSFLPNVTLYNSDSEINMINKLLALVEYFDPDILSGFEINSTSWGYIIERFKKTLNINILPQLSRCKVKTNSKFGDRWGYTHTSNFTIVGRFSLNVWRVLRRDVNLNNYNFENCCLHIFHRTFPKFTNLQLSNLLRSDNVVSKFFAFMYYMNKIHVIQYFITSQDIIERNTELSRLIGIDFNSNFYRGSQFKVESILTRFTKLENLLLNSPSKLQIHHMTSLEQIPLIMEPDSNFYKSPLIVLDFQSLYPSIIIAYNLCYSTLLCKLEGFKPNRNPIGYLRNVPLPPMLLDLLYKNNGIHITPNGFVFIRKFFRKSILAKMLLEILTLRINIKKFMRKCEQLDNPDLLKILNSRQLALKLIANVTYGYTSATFSGRMPNSDIADAIVATGREILTQSIDMINESGMGAKVVYGDTDSLFVYLPGKTRDESFVIGDKLAKMISEKFPDPVQLKFEKVYHPCILLSKKRYVGNAYEYPDQKKPKFDAKGIETIRRDGIPAQQKILEKSLKILFETSNLSLVKSFVIGEFNKITQNKAIIKDFCFAKEVRYGTYKNEQYLPPGAIVAQKKVGNDERSEPQYRERVPYVVYRDSTKPRLKDRCLSPEEFIASLDSPTPLQLDYEYYITKVLIPPLERIFNLIGVDIQLWYKEVTKPADPISKNNDITKFKFINKLACVNCGSGVNQGRLCDNCSDTSQVIIDNNLRMKDLESKLDTYNKLCVRCIGYQGNSSSGSLELANSCINNDCVNYYNRIKTTNELNSHKNHLQEIYRVLDA